MIEPKKSNNLKTALMLGAVALLFFIAVIVKRTWLMP